MKLNSLKTKFLAAFLPLFFGSFAVFFCINYFLSGAAFALASVILLLADAIALYVSASQMTRPIELLEAECERINQRDLTDRPVCYASDDELGALAKGLSQMRGTLRDLLKDISKNAQRVSSSASDLTAAANQTAEAATTTANQVVDIAEGINTQSESISTTNAAVKDISNQSEAVSTSAEAITAVTDMTVAEVGRGKGAIQDIVTAMDAINVGTGTVRRSIEKLARQSDEISKIVDVITGIAEQTNLLALNAAIEAARAGEVRKLAEESANSSQKIAELVTKIQEDMKEAVEASGQSTESVEGSRQSVQEADTIFESIQVSIEALAGGIRDVASNITAVSDAAKSMASEVESVAKISHENASRTQSVSAATEEQSASSEEIAASTRVLSELAQELEEDVRKFKL